MAWLRGGVHFYSTLGCPKPSWIRSRQGTVAFSMSVVALGNLNAYVAVNMAGACTRPFSLHTTTISSFKQREENTIIGRGTVRTSPRTVLGWLTIECRRWHRQCKLRGRNGASTMHVGANRRAEPRKKGKKVAFCVVLQGGESKEGTLMVTPGLGGRKKVEGGVG